MVFEIDEMAILNQKAIKGLPSHVGELVTISRFRKDISNYDYDIRLPNGDFVFAKESELNKLTEEELQIVTYIQRGNKAIYSPTNEEVKITKVDFLHGQAEILFDDGGVVVIGFEHLMKIDEESDSVEESNTTINDNLLRILFNHYKNEDDTYTVPKQLLLNLLDNIFEE